MDSKNKTQIDKQDFEQISKEERVPFIANDKIEMLARQAALINEVDPDVAMQIARLIFATAAVADGQAIAKITLKIHDTDIDEGRLRAHGKYGVCLACIKVDTQIGHVCASIAPGSSRCCLLPDAMVRLASGGSKQAKDLSIGDSVEGFDSSGNLVGDAAITDLMKDHYREGYYVLNDSLGITADHPVLVMTSMDRPEWRRLDRLSVGDKLFTPTGSLEIKSIRYIEEPCKTVYVETNSPGFAVEHLGSRMVVSGQYLLDAIAENLKKLGDLAVLPERA